jgi:hypothetical protein
VVRLRLKTAKFYALTANNWLKLSDNTNYRAYFAFSRAYVHVDRSGVKTVSKESLGFVRAQNLTPERRVLWAKPLGHAQAGRDVR